MPTADSYYLKIFNYHSNDIYYEKTSDTPETVVLEGLPDSGSDVTVWLYTRHNGGWEDVIYYDLKSFKLEHIRNATLTSHTNWQQLNSSTQTFTWEDVGAEQYELRVARRHPTLWYDIVELLTVDGSTTSVTINDLPTNGGQVLIRLRTKHSGWAAKYYTFTGTEDHSKAILTSHKDKGTLASTSEIFTWNTVAGAEAYHLMLRNPIADYDVKFARNFEVANPAEAKSGIPISATIDNLPQNIAGLQLTLSTKHHGYWDHQIIDLTSTGGIANAEITSHSPDQKITTSSETISWSDVGADAYQIRIIDKSASSYKKIHDKIYDGSVTSITLHNLPKDNVLHIAVFTKHGDWWASNSLSVVTEIP